MNMSSSRKKQYKAKKGRRIFDNNGYESPVWKAYWAKIDAEEKAKQEE
tara:strand:- start:164 stop:307 length:144 start_codon:yes stop_codon:yes gene_type:complete